VTALPIPDWPPVLLPPDRPRRPGVPACRSAVAWLPRAELGVVPDTVVYAGFAAVLFRYTGQDRITVHRPGDRLRYVVTGGSTLRALVPDIAPAEDADVALAVGPDRVEVHYDADLFDPATIGRLLGHLRTLVVDATLSPDQPVALLRLLPDVEAQRVLVEWNRTETDLPQEICLHRAFEARVTMAPDAIAVVHGERRWTYRQVNTTANRIAHHLRGLGVGPDVRVGLCLDRSPELLVSVLGILKAGGAYVPLDPDYPTDRLATMVAGTSCSVMVSRSGLTANLPETTVPLVLLDRDADMLSEQPTRDPGVRVGPDHLCYIIHTSGSSGVPKPIALRHRGVMNNLADLNTRFGVGPGDAVLALSSPSFDMSVYEFLGSTVAGGTVVVPDADRTRDPAHWAELLATEQVTVWNSAPALLGLLADHLEQAGGPALPALRLAMLGGDWVPVPLCDRVRAFAPDLRFVVMGGATEASIHSTIYEVEATDPNWTSIPYGRPMANQRTYILDDARQPVPPGVTGELYLAGVGLARGYLDQPERTEERFVRWSYGEVTGERLYRTGDLARFGQDGLIELLGRADFQVKINGLRVELGEIEAVLRRHPGVRKAAVVARAGRLLAYVVGTDVAGLRELVAGTLPDYMVPAAIVRLDELPLTPNGKVDRNGLPDPEVPAGEYRAPTTATERALAEVCADVLGLPRYGVTDDFIAMGGDSIRAIQVVTRARNRGIAVTAGQVLRQRTIAELAPHVTALTDDVAPLALTADAELTRRYPHLAEVWPLTPMQSAMLFESMANETTYQLRTVYHLSGDVDAERLRAAGQALLDRHPALRVAFVDDRQVVVDGVPLPWQEIDLRDLAASTREDAFRQFLNEDDATRFDLTTPPVLRLTLVRFGPAHSRLVLTAHHAVVDGWSEQVIARDIVRLYAGEDLEPAGSYGDYLAWLSHQDGQAAATAWAAELDGVTPTLLAPRTANPDIHELAVPLAELTNTLGVTANTVAQGAWALLLGALTGRDDVVFGATVAGRPGALPGVESAVGLFINTVPVRASLNGTVREFLTTLQDRQTALLDHQHHALGDIHAAQGVDALFDTLVVFQSFPNGRGSADHVTVDRIESLGGGSYPLTLIIEPHTLTVQYDRNAFDRNTVEDIATRFGSVAAQLATNGDRPVDSLDLPAPLTTTQDTEQAATGYRAGRTATEEALCALFADVLGLDRVGIDDNIFALGCNSLKATRILSRMRKTLGVETSIVTMFEFPTIADLSSRVRTTTARPGLRRMAG
jgi:amino acid adenylation domain-containing protein